MPKPLKPILLILSAVFLTDLSAESIEIETKPINMEEFTCTEFATKSKNCEAYVCQTPYNLDPTISTEWKIIGKKGDRCLISNTTNDVGLKDEHDQPKPVTKTCEYDKTGIANLNRTMDDMKKGYFELPSENPEGLFECAFTSNGRPINAEPYLMRSDLD